MRPRGALEEVEVQRSTVSWRLEGTAATAPLRRCGPRRVLNADHVGARLPIAPAPSALPPTLWKRKA
jgi:hypothetical protein